MSIVSIENQTLSNLVKRQLWNDTNYNSEVVTINDSAATLQIGTVLGKVTATGKYKVAIQSAVDGSQVADAVVERVTIVPNATDTLILTISRGPCSISKGALILSSTYSTQAMKDIVYASLTAKGMQVLETI
jgi:Bacteriophage lambda head decoration protein D